MSNPTELKYTSDHIWIKENSGNLLIGITDYAQEQLGDILFVDLPEAGKAFEAGEAFFEIESQKTAQELSLPFGGEVIASNDALDDSPELINEDAFEAWIVEIKPSGAVEGVMGSSEYEESIQE
ncbi:MAG: glycine cleavage system protein GcvH [Eubacteriaceae bacterium]|nr:glycine cleavage system protein GcvH [Eubacteriaceae bacterium]